MKSIAILFGGPGNERAVSAKTAQQIYQALESTVDYTPTLVELTTDLRLISDTKVLSWHDLQSFAFVFIAIHGAYGEDGKIQAILDSLKISYNGSGVQASLLAMDKLLTQQLVSLAGVDVPNTQVWSRESIPHQDRSTLQYPLVIKPNQSGSSVGVSIASNLEELDQALTTAFTQDETVLVQEYIPGREFTCGVIKNHQDQNPLYLLPPVEIIPNQGFFDYANKYTEGLTKEICPAEIDSRLTQRIQDLALTIHTILGCNGLTRSDFRYDESTDRLVFLEINTIPGQTETSLCPKEAQAIGKEFSEFILDQIHLGAQASTHRN